MGEINNNINNNNNNDSNKDINEDGSNRNNLPHSAHDFTHFSHKKPRPVLTLDTFIEY